MSSGNVSNKDNVIPPAAKAGSNEAPMLIDSDISDDDEDLPTVPLN